MAKQPVKKGLIYSGPVTPLDIEGEAEPVMLFPGTVYPDLPIEHPIVITLMERGLLQPAPVIATEVIETETAPIGAAN